MKKVLTCIIALLAWAGNASADELQIEDIHIAPGQTQTVAVKLENESHRYIMIQFDLQLPKGVRIAKDEDGDLQVKPNEERFTRSHRLVVDEIDTGRYRILIYSTVNAALLGNTGTLLGIALTAADEDAYYGIYIAKVLEQVFADENEEGYEYDDFTFGIEISKSLPGDVNMDGSITIADVTALVNIILGKDDTEPYQYDHEAADVNGDSAVTIADVTALVNIILGKD